MSEPRPTGLLARTGAAWEGFFFRPVSTANAVAIRIAFGVVMAGWALSVWPDLFTFFSDEGVLPEHPSWHRSWGLLQVFGSDTAVLVFWGAMLAAAIGLILGVAPRLMCLVALITLVSLLRRNHYIDNSGDLLLRNWAFLFLFLPMGTALTLPGVWRDRAANRTFPRRPIWPLRLVQIQLSLGYLFSAWAKVPGETWLDGTAVGYALRIEDLIRFRVPEFVIDNLIIVNVLTYGTLVLELALAILIWNRRLRPWVLIAGVGLHLGIHLTLEVGFFSWGMLIGYLAFVRPAVIGSALHRLRSAIGTERRSPNVT